MKKLGYNTTNSFIFFISHQHLDQLFILRTACTRVKSSWHDNETCTGTRLQ